MGRGVKTVIALIILACVHNKSVVLALKMAKTTEI